MPIRSMYNTHPKGLYYFSVQWSEDALTWKLFNDMVIGSYQAHDPNSLLSQIMGNWKHLGLVKEPSVKHALYASQSAVRAMADRVNWLDVRPELDYYGKELMKRGLKHSDLRMFRFDPFILISSHRQTLWDKVAGLSADDCLIQCERLANKGSLSSEEDRDSSRVAPTSQTAIGSKSPSALNPGFKAASLKRPIRKAPKGIISLEKDAAALELSLAKPQHISPTSSLTAIKGLGVKPANLEAVMTGHGAGAPNVGHLDETGKRAEFPPWYHGPLAKAKAEKLLLDGEPGCGRFLIRCQKLTSADFVVSIYDGRVCGHFAIRRKAPNALLTLNGIPTGQKTLHALVELYKTQKPHFPIPLFTDGVVCKVIILFNGHLTKSPPVKSPDEKTDKQWLTRYFELCPNKLAYYVDSTKVEMKGTIDLASAGLIPFVECSKQFTFAIKCAKRIFFLQGSSKENLESWVRAIGGTIGEILPATLAGGGNVPTGSDVMHRGMLVISPPSFSPDKRTNKRWLGRWFELCSSSLKYYAGASKTELKGTIDLSGAALIPSVVCSRQFTFAIKCAKRNFFLQCADQNDVDGWLNAIAGTIGEVLAPMDMAAVHRGKRDGGQMSNIKLQVSDVDEGVMNIAEEGRDGDAGEACAEMHYATSDPAGGGTDTQASTVPPLQRSLSSDRRARAPIEGDGHSPYLHPGLKQKDACKMLMLDNGTKGSGKFLLTKKTPGGNDCTLHIVHQHKIQHFAVTRRAVGEPWSCNRFQTGCTSLSDMIKLCRKTSSFGLPLKLTEGLKYAPPAGYDAATQKKTTMLGTACDPSTMPDSSSSPPPGRMSTPPKRPSKHNVSFHPQSDNKAPGENQKRRRKSHYFAMIHSQQPAPTSGASGSDTGWTDSDMDADPHIDEGEPIAMRPPPSQPWDEPASELSASDDSLGESSSNESNDAPGSKTRSLRSSFDGTANMFKSRANESRRKGRSGSVANDSRASSRASEPEQGGRRQPRSWRSSFVRARRKPSVKLLGDVNKSIEGEAEAEAEGGSPRMRPRKRRSSMTSSIAGFLLSGEAAGQGDEF